MTAAATKEAPRTAPAVIDPKKAARKEILQTVMRYGHSIVKLAPRGTEAGYYVESLRLHLATNPKLLECNPLSIARGVLRTAMTGLELGVTCDLLPFGSVCQYNTRYNGFIELGYKVGVRRIEADVVREGDFFEWQKGTESFLRHRAEHKNKNAPITFGYALAEIKQGSAIFEVMSREEIDDIRQRFSKTWWKESEKKGGRLIPLEEIEWYGKKTPIRQLAPYWPKNGRLANALRFADTEEAEEIPDAEYEIMDDLGEDVDTRPSVPTSPPSRPVRGSAALPEEYGSATAAPGRTTSTVASEAQIKQLRDLIADPSITEPVRKKVEKRIDKGLDLTTANTWIGEITMAIANAKPQTTSDDDDSDDRLPFGDKLSIEQGIAANEARAAEKGL